MLFKSSEKDKKPEDIIIPLQPTKLFWVVHHTSLAKSIRILDITSQSLSHYNPAVGLDDDFKKLMKEIAEPLVTKEKTEADVYTVKKQSWWRSKYLMFPANASEAQDEAAPQIEQPQIQDDKEEPNLWSDGAIAHWKAPCTSKGTTVLSFPSQSPHSSHSLSLKPKYWGSRTERYIQDSVSYSWKPEHRLSNRRWLLTRQVPSEKKEVARFAMVFNWEWGMGGLLVVDTSKDGVDPAVACLGALVMLKKKRQRAAEHSHSGGGG